MSECWIISVPSNNAPQQAWEKLEGPTKRANLSENFKFNIPDLKVGTLDALIGLSDDLGKIDSFAEGYLKLCIFEYLMKQAILIVVFRLKNN